MSSSDVVIRVEGLGKKYALHHEKSERYTALRDVVASKAKATGRLLNPFTLARQLRQAQREAAAPSEEDFWALRDVSFEIPRGERVGIIGRNGAGKSTLLKILSRITEPTMGRVEIRGRVASLLEVGTGFHPELTGRENIYLNGAILGMTRREIRSKFDEIVDFAEVEKFLDTPVKRYSSGMYVRLAFAVAAHLEPEILLVDEVLAVGDETFRKKCLNRMNSISSKEGKTIIFVSHDLSAIQNLCSLGYLFSNGALVSTGRPVEVIKEYNKINSSAPCSLTSDSLEIQHLKIDHEGDCMRLSFSCRAITESENIDIWVALKSLNDSTRAGYLSSFNNGPLQISDEFTVLAIEVNTSLLSPGDYEVVFSVLDRTLSRSLQNSVQVGIVNINLLPSHIRNSDRYHLCSKNLPSVLLPGRLVTNTSI